MAIFRESSEVQGNLSVRDDIFFGTQDSAATIKQLQAAGSQPNIGFDFITKGTGIVRVPTGYEANITAEPRALVNKAYADARMGGMQVTSLVTSPGVGQNGYAITWDNAASKYTLTASGFTTGQGITLAPPSINLGGAVTQVTTDVNLTVAGDMYWRSNFGTNPAGFRAQSTSLNNNQAIMYGGGVQILAKFDQLVVTANVTGGMQYAADYSGIFNVTRSIPDIAWTSSHLGSKVLTAAAKTPAGGQDGWVVYWNNSTGFYDLKNVTTGSMAIGAAVTTGTPKSVLFVDASGTLAQDVANFNWDYTNKYLGVGIGTPTAFVHVGAGTTTKPAFKMTSGAALTTIAGAVQDGAFEYTGTHLNFIIGSTRFQIDQQSAGSAQPFFDNVALLKNFADPTKMAIINVGTISTGTTRSFLLPDASGTIALTSDITGLFWTRASGGPLTGPNLIAGNATNTIQFEFSNLGTTQVDGAGLLLQNSQAALVGAVQMSPSLTWHGRVWETTGGTSQIVKYTSYNLPVQGTTANANWQLDYSLNGGAYTNAIRFESASESFVLGSSSGGQILIGTGGVGLQRASGHLLLTNGGSTANPTERMRIAVTTGNVMIGSSTQNARLYVVQASLASGHIPVFRTDPGVHTAIVANSELFANQFVGANWTWAAGTTPVQRFNYFAAFNVITGLVSSGFTAYFDAPTGNITNAYSIGVQGKSLFTGIIVSTADFNHSGSTFNFGNTDQFGLNLMTGNVTKLSISGAVGNVSITPLATATATTNTALTVTTPTHTIQVASAEETHVNFNFTNTVQFSTGAMTQLRAFRVQAPVYAFVGASTVTNAYGSYFEQPTPGTNATLSGAWSIGSAGNMLFTGTNGIVFNDTLFSANTSPYMNAYNSLTTSLGMVYIRTLNGTNTSGGLLIGPKGTGQGATLKAFLSLANLDYGVSFPANREEFNFQSAGATFLINAFRAGTGVARPITIQSDSTTVITVTTAKNVLIGNTSSDNAALYVVQTAAAVVAGWIPAMRVDPGPHTVMTASAEFPNIVVNTVTQQWNTGALTTQRNVWIKSPTLGFVAASTATDAYNLYLDAPLPGTNATLTGAWALGVNGKMKFVTTPTNDNAQVNLVTVDGTTGEVKYRTVASLPGGGITNSAINTELMMSNGTNAISSNLFATPANGTLTLGSTSLAAQRTIIAQTSDANASLGIQGKGGATFFFSSLTAGTIATLNVYDGDFQMAKGGSTAVLASRIQYQKGRGNISGYTTLINGDTLGILAFGGFEGTGLHSGAIIKAISNGTVATGSVPADLLFMTGTGGTSDANTLERMRITSGGLIEITGKVSVGPAIITPNVEMDINGGLAIRQTSNAQITANQNNYAIGSGTSFRLNTDASRNITGITGGFDGKILVIMNIGANPIVFTNEDALSTAANRITCSTAANITIAAKGCLTLMYDATNSRWVDIAVR